MFHLKDFYELALPEIRELKRTKPELESLLDYYELILEAQREAKRSFQPDLDGLDVETWPERASEGVPLLKPEDIKVDWDLFGHLFDRIGQISQQHTETNAIGSWSSISDNEGPWHDVLLEGLLKDPTLLAGAAARAGVRLDVFAFLAGQTLTPLLETYAERLRGYIDGGVWLRGYCPVCGGEPLMGKLEQETGKRLLGCCLCRTEWVFKRLECPFCANSDQEELRYFYDEGNPVYRVEVCDGCKTYLKTVDTREKAKEVPLFVENLATVDLDLVAKGEGFQRETTRLFGL